MKILIKSQRLYITEFDESMASSVHLNSLDDDNRRFIPDEVFETVAAAKETLSTLISFYSRKDAPLVYAVILNDGRQIGHVQAYPVSNGWEIGFHIAKPFTGNGYATEAIKAFLPFIMRHLDIEQLYGMCHADNFASRKVMEKCGFALVYEGIGQYHGSEQLICNYVFKNEGNE